MSAIRPSLLKDQIYDLLTGHTHLRDDDYKLIANIWHAEIAKQNLSHSEVLKHYANHKLTPAESITRCRRKLQEVFPHLRGKSYTHRIAEQEIVKHDLKNNFSTIHDGANKNN